MENQTKQAIKGFHLYIPEDLLEAYRTLAQEDGRSVNAQIIWVLRQYVKKQKGN